MTVQLEQPVKQAPPRDLTPDARRVPSGVALECASPHKPEMEETLKAPAGAWGY